MKKGRSKICADRARLEALATLFFKMVNEYPGESIEGVEPAVPFLARILQEFDFVLGVRRDAASSYAAAIDARMLSVLFITFKRNVAAERKRKIRECVKDGFFDAQLKAIEKASLKIPKNDEFFVAPCAILPLGRLDPDCQTEELVHKARHAREGHDAEVRQ